MPHTPDYRCTRCGRDETKDRLTALKVSFLRMGIGGRTLKSRVIAWLCPGCLGKDKVYNSPEHSGPAYRPRNEDEVQRVG